MRDTTAKEHGRRKEQLKAILRRLHAGESPEALKGEFGALLDKVGAAEVGAIERELIDEGLPAAEVQRLCDVHLSLFSGGLERGGLPELPPGHPARILINENRQLELRLGRLRPLLDKLDGGKTLKEVATDLRGLFDELAELELHYQRKENQLFPFLERRGLSGPTQVMWGVHDEVRELFKECRRSLDAGEPECIVTAGRAYAEKAAGMVEKEELVLLPLALENLSDDDWRAVRTGGSEIGYAWHAPVAFETPATAPAVDNREDGMHQLNTGELTTEQLDLLLRHLPFDVTFVDENDEVRYFSASDERIFARSPGIIGRKVQNCHPPKSVEMVQRIVAAFKAGERDEAEFYIHLDEKYVHIRYFALRDDAGAYRGVIEVSQDIAPLQRIEGERRLLDWE